MKDHIQELTCTAIFLVHLVYLTAKYVAVIGYQNRSPDALFNSPPWFYKVSESTLSDIELQSCGDKALGDENIALELVKIFVQ